MSYASHCLNFRIIKNNILQIIKMVPKTKLEGHLLSASTCIEGPTYFTRSPGVEYKKLSKKKKKKKKESYRR